MAARWELALQQKTTKKKLEEFKELQQNELFSDENECPAGLDSFNFIRDLQCNNMERKIEFGLKLTQKFFASVF